MNSLFKKFDVMYSPLTLDALRVLDAIDRKKSFAAAAEELFRVPSAISYTISKLEEELEVKLFDRSKQRAVLTPVGQLILEQGRHILRATEELTCLARAAADGWEVEMKIAVDSLLSFSDVYPLVRAFQAESTRTEIRLIEEVLGGSWDALDSGRCDLVIGASGESLGSGFTRHILGQVEFVFAVSKDHPFNALHQPLTASDLRDATMVVVADSSRHLPARSSGLLDGRSRIVVPSIEQKILAQSQGLGVGYLPLHRIRTELAAGTLKILMLEEPRPRQTLFAAWRSTNKGKALKWFVSQLQTMRFDEALGLVSALPEGFTQKLDQ